LTRGPFASLSTSSLGFRLGSTVMLALLPLGILTVAQTRDALNQVDATTLDGVGGAALQAVRSQIDLIRDAQISARVLASVLGRSQTGDTACVDRVSAVARDIPQATLVAFIPMTGLMTCASNGRVFDFAGDPLFDGLIELPIPKIVYNPRGPVSGTAVVGVSHPVFDASGVQIGITAISLAYTSVRPDHYADAVAQWRPSFLATYLADGSLLLSSDADPASNAAVPPAIDPTRLPEYADRAVFAETPEGRQILSVVGVTDDLFLVSVWQPLDAGFWGQVNGFSPYFLPVLTWIAALAAAAFASSQFVTRHVRALARSMADYVTSRTRVEIPDMRDAPREIQSLHAAYAELVQTIEQDEADLQNLVIDKDILIREVNHRSGNSLQIMASIMRMYRRETSDPEMKAVLDGLINRVIALSSTHTSLYVLSGRRDVAIDEVLLNVIKRLKEIHGVVADATLHRLDPVRIDAPAAVPLALALAEAVGCFFAHPSLSKDSVAVSLSDDGGQIRLRIDGPPVPELMPDGSSGIQALPRRMLTHLALQLSGQLDLAVEAGTVRVDLTFPRPAAGAVTQAPEASRPVARDQE
jgi:two-component system, sensor histidine kinase PdtaS